MMPGGAHSGLREESPSPLPSTGLMRGFSIQESLKSERTLGPSIDPARRAVLDLRSALSPPRRRLSIVARSPLASGD
jgi:hypothetical protein